MSPPTRHGEMPCLNVGHIPMTSWIPFPSTLCSSLVRHDTTTNGNCLHDWFRRLFVTSFDVISLMNGLMLDWVNSNLNTFQIKKVIIKNIRCAHLKRILLSHILRLTWHEKWPGRVPPELSNVWLHASVLKDKMISATPNCGTSWYTKKGTQHVHHKGTHRTFWGRGRGLSTTQRKRHKENRGYVCCSWVTNTACCATRSVPWNALWSKVKKKEHYIAMGIWRFYFGKIGAIP